MSPLCHVAAPLLLVVLVGAAAGDPPAEPPPAGSYGATYTVEELAALDRALHAGNLTRTDLTFQKDMAKGTHCLPVVRAMLRDPLLIASRMDELARSLHAAAYVRPDPSDGSVGDLPGPILALISATTLFRDLADERDISEVNTETLFTYLTGPPTRSETADPRQRALAYLERRLAVPADFFPAPDGTLAAPDDIRLLLLRRKLPDEMLMREVLSSPFDAAGDAAIEAHMKGKPASYVAELAAETHGEERVPLRAARDFAHALPSVEEVRAWPREAFPTDTPLVQETPYGRIALGTYGDDVYVGDFSAIVDPGGNDRYERGRFAAAFGTTDRRVGLLLDLGGDDVYACGDVDCTLGAAILGVAILEDLGQGNDRYEGGHLSLGAAVGGIALLYDDGGSDVYVGKTFTQGAAGYGIGILYDGSEQPAPALKTDEETKDPIAIAAWDNDRYQAWCTAQGFSRTLGVGLCINVRGNEVYEAGGVYLHAPLFSDRYQSFSQGFSIGAREHDIAGGVAALIDLAGNDRYLGDIYNQGVGYWYAAGLLYDGGGHDLYEMTQYGQGSGIHLAVGGLVDVSGNDAYVMHSGLGQGGSHDFAASVLHDRGGNDRYHGNTSCNGCGLTNSVGLFIDRAGDDTYAARRDGGLNAGRPARGFGSVGLLLDLAGKDDYLGTFKDDELWRTSDLGLGIDVPSAAPATPAGGAPAADQSSGKIEVPAVCTYEGPLTQAVFDELWALCVRWEVGENRAIVPVARKRLIAFGPDILPLLDAKMEKDESGLELRAFVDVLAGVRGAAGGAVEALLARNLASPLERRRKVALHLIGELKATENADGVVALLDGADLQQARRAAGVLLQIGSHAGEAQLKAWLTQADERLVLAALGNLLGLGADVYPDVRPLLAHPMVSVRTRLVTALAEKQTVYGPRVLADLGASDLSDRARRSLLDAVVRGPIAPGDGAMTPVLSLLEHADWGVRGDAARVLKRWADLDSLPREQRDACRLALAKRLASEPEPYVRRMAEGR